MNFYIYDLETFREQFLFIGKFRNSPDIQVFEISKRCNHKEQLLQWLSYLQNSKALMVGFNNLNFDYPIIHELLTNPYTFTELTAHLKANEIIRSQGYGFTSIKLTDRILPQIDLVKVNHFDNKARRTSLKALQFAMRSETVEDLPFDPEASLTNEQMNMMVQYGIHDVKETEKFFELCKHVVDIRGEILGNGVLSGDVFNYSDVKLGTEYLTRKIGRNKCYSSGSTPRQTFRESIHFQDIILPKISFRTEKFNEVLDWFKKQTIWIKSEEERPTLEANLAGLPFQFGVGGVHASVENKFFESNSDFVIRDIDVSGMYVAVAIANGFFPEHLGQEFVTAYRQLQADRKAYPKGSSMNLILKLAGNGAFGNSNNSYSCFYDPRYTFSVTVNGQLQLLQLAELLSLIPKLQIIQANTDGVTALVPRSLIPFFDLWKNEWEAITGLKLEEVEYSKMWIRDVNNYFAVTTTGVIKAKGAYWYPKVAADYWGGSGSTWNKDFSNMVVQKAIEQVFLTGCRPEDIVRLASNPFDFMLRYKASGGAKVFIGDKQMLRTTRYYVSTKGEKMYKRAAPKGELGAWKRKPGLTDKEFSQIFSQLAPGQWDERVHTKKKTKYVEVVTNIENDRLVKCCNNVRDFDFNDVDWDYYTQEIRKLLIGEADGQNNFQPVTN